MKSQNPAHLNPAATDRGLSVYHRVGIGRWHCLLPALALMLAPESLYGVNVPQPAKAELADLASGRLESDETDGDEDLKTLQGTRATGRVEIRMTVNSGSYRWTIRQGEAEIEAGTLESRSGWMARPGTLGRGLYSLEVTRLGEEPGEDAFRRRIDFASGIAKGDLDTVRKSHDALARHGRKDYLGTMKALEPVDVRSAPVPRKMREQLAWARIDGMFYFRKLEDIFPAIEAYKADHPSSERLGAVRECEMAAQFERGLKKSLESVRFKNGKSNERRAEGRANLVQFLSLAGEHSSGDYTVLPKRKLRQDLWTARLILGEEEEAAAAIGDPALREEFRLHCALMCPEIRPERTDENIARMREFLRDYSDSDACPRVELDLAGVALLEGERLVDVDGQPKKAEAYLELAQERYSHVVENQAAGIENTDVGDAWEGMLRAYYWQGDEANLVDWTANIILMTEPGSSLWRLAKLYQGDSLIRQEKYDQAETVLDELVALGFKGNPSHDGHTSAAVNLKIGLAHRVRDEAKARMLVDLVRESDCVASIRKQYEDQESR